MKYKVGDKVTIREDLNAGVEYWMEDGSAVNHATQAMVKLKSQICTIEYTNNGQYQLEEDPEHWNWTDEMFAEPTKETPTTPSGIHMTFGEWMIIQNLLWSECRDLEASLILYPDSNAHPRTHEYVANTIKKLKTIGDKVDIYIDRENDHPLWWKRKDPNFYWLKGGKE